MKVEVLTKDECEKFEWQPQMLCKHKDGWHGITLSEEDDDREVEVLFFDRDGFVEPDYYCASNLEPLNKGEQITLTQD